MRKIFGLAAIGGIGWGLRKLLAQRTANPAEVDLRQPQKTVENVEQATGEPVRP